MSATVEKERALSPSPQSSKKRKAATANLETSKKRRKKEKVDSNFEAVAEAGTPKKDKKRKQREKSEEHPMSSQQAPDVEDVELPDAHAIEPSPSVEVVPNGSLEPTDIQLSGIIEEVDDSQLYSQQPSCFYEKRLSLQLPIPAISLTSSTSSLLSLHLAPLLLTYFPPAGGIVLSFSDPVLSAKPNDGINLPLVPPRSKVIPRSPPDETFARCGDGYGVCWVWLTVTFLVFKPESGDELKGWTNVTSEGFVGLVSYNYFQTAVGKSRIPKAWTWNGPVEENSRGKKKSRKEKLQSENGEFVSQEDSEGASQQTNLGGNDVSGESGSFLDADGQQVSESQTFRVVDTEMVPGHEKDRWMLQIEGSLLSSEEDTAVVLEERKRFEQIQSRGRSRSGTVDSEAEGFPLMSGALSFSRVASPE